MTHSFPPPELLKNEADQFFEDIAEAMGSGWEAVSRRLDADTQLAAELQRLVIASDFARKSMSSDPSLLYALLGEGDQGLAVSLHSVVSLNSTVTAEQLLYWLTGLVAQYQPVTADVLDKTLRRARRFLMLRIIWRDVNRLATLAETTAELSDFAALTIQAAADFHYAELVKLYGQPLSATDKSEQPFLVLGMGKLGAWELNLSSDIDLIFAYPESGETEHKPDAKAKKTLSNQEFFIRLGQRVIKSLDAITVDGFVFRVDMRLRPFGQSGPLALNFASLEAYYQEQGREWERYAMIKARVVACSYGADTVPTQEQIACDSESQALMAMLRPFTYRKYIDYSVIEAMRDMKAMINREVQRKGKHNDVKLGFGGIREVEFIVQVFQLIRGGRQEEYQARKVMKLLRVLDRDECFEPGVTEKLTQAYEFLRNVEHALQAWQDMQTQMLPIDEGAQLRLAWVMGFPDWPSFWQVLSEHRELVNQEFQAVIAARSDQAEVVLDNFWQLAWQASETQEDIEVFNAEQADEIIGIEELLQQCHSLKSARSLQMMQAEGRVRMNTFMPLLLAALVSERSTEIASALVLQRMLPLIESVARRSVYLVLLMENPGALQQLVRLCAASPWIASELALHPVLLDELLDPRSLYSPPEKAELESDLRQHMLRVPWDDLEEQMEALRYFRLARSLRIAASEVSGAMPLMKVSDALTWTAEVILEHVVQLAWELMVSRHGAPGGEKQRSGDSQFIVVGYGKLGGIELGHGSDLDLVFIHDAEPNAYTDGEKSIDNQTFYTRLGQKVIHVLNTRTVSGQLYEVDMRLRPSGNSGLLVSSLSAFERYQKEQAWSWEQQALVRARPVAGSVDLADRFNQLRQKLLVQPRELPKLRQDVVEMRQKMRDHLGSSAKTDEFHLKQDAGGIVDIEFMVQYAALAWAHLKPDLIKYSDNIRILESLQHAGLMAAEDVTALIDAYIVYRSAAHRRALQQQSLLLPATAFAEQREKVQNIWQQLLLAP